MKLFRQKNKAEETVGHQLLEAQKEFKRGTTSLKDLIAPSAMKIESSYLEVSGKFARTFFVLTYPRYLSSNWLSPIINLDLPMDIAMFIYPMETDVVMKKLRDKVGQLQATISMN